MNQEPYILFLCRGNVARSVFAEYLFNKNSKLIKAVSAGTKFEGGSKSLDELFSRPHLIFDMMEEEGIDVTNHTRRLITPEMVANAYMVVDMAEPETVPAFVTSHPRHIVWTIDDPKGKSLEEYIRIKGEIKEKVLELLNDNNW